MHCALVKLDSGAMAAILEIEVGELIDEIHVREVGDHEVKARRVGRAAIKFAAVELIDHGSAWVTFSTSVRTVSVRCRVDAGYAPNAARDAEFVTAVEAWRDHG